MSKPLNYLVIHCTATVEGLDLSGKDIKAMHMNPKSKGGRGWSRPGYRTVVRLDGQADQLVKANLNAIVENEEMTWGAKGINSESHHISYIGGIGSDMKPKDTRTDLQKHTLAEIVKFYIYRMNPDIKIIGHNQVANKACPSFSVPNWLREIGIPEKNILDDDPHGYNKYFETGKW